MASKPSKPKTTTLLLLTLLLSTLHYLTHLHPAPKPAPNPRWFDAIARHLKTKNINIGLVNTVDSAASIPVKTEGNIVKVHFEQVGQGVQWSHLFPEWIDEDAPATCPEIPLPDPGEYGQLDVVVARAPCGGSRDVYRLQVNLAVADLLVRSGAVFAVFVGRCGPMWEIFRCEELMVRGGGYWVYRPEIGRMKRIVDMPVGSCRLSPPAPPAQLGKSIKQQPREAFATILHSSEAYVCGAIALAQSILRSNSSKDLLLLADADHISPPSLAALRLAGWKIRRVRRIRNPHAARNAYNEWNYTKLRLWQLRGYDKVVFVDADLVVARNLDHLFAYPEVSAAGNDGHVFNSGVMVVEPSACAFEAMMKKRWAVRSYNGGDQGFLNEMFPWWHRLPTRVNRLTFFGSGKDDEHRIKDDVYAVHYLGLKPWMCYRDYDCNWDKAETRQFASDSANAEWWRVYDGMSEELRRHCALAPETEARIRKYRHGAKSAGFPDGHWKIEIKDPRQNIMIR